MKALLLLVCAILSCTGLFARSGALVIDHNCTNLPRVPVQYTSLAKKSFRIGFGHTSHGSQLVKGMTALNTLYGKRYGFNDSGTDTSLTFHDMPFSGAADLGNPDRITWASSTRTYLAQHPEVNIIMWSWCGQVAGATTAEIDTYLSLMSGLERDYPAVTFVYMTGHLDGTGATGSLNINNERIRKYCRDSAKVLYDFADIESYDPAGATNYMVLKADDACDYDSDGNGSRDKNWITDWLASHPTDTLTTLASICTDCSHSPTLNCVIKGRAFWWLMASLAGWSTTTSVSEEYTIPVAMELLSCYPNPFNPTTVVRYQSPAASMVQLRVYDMLGREVAELVNEWKEAGEYNINFDGRGLGSGVYICRLSAGDRVASQKMMLLK
jgi:hypothetical protein